jgi:hypothetical protein
MQEQDQLVLQVLKVQLEQLAQAEVLLELQAFKDLEEQQVILEQPVLQVQMGPLVLQVQMVQQELKVLVEQMEIMDLLGLQVFKELQEQLEFQALLV